MAGINYWIEALNGALEEVGELNHFTNEQKILMADFLTTSAENESLSNGSLVIPSPYLAEIEKIKKNHHAEIELHRKGEESLREKIADLRQIIRELRNELEGRSR